MVRLANINDLADLIHLGFNFANAAEVPYDPATIEQLFRHWLTDRRSIVFVWEDPQITAFFVGELFHWMFKTDILVAEEIALWSEAKSLKAINEMIYMFECWAKFMGAKFCDISSYAPIDNDRLGRVYKRKKYSLTRTHYRKGLF
jgi:hypothetical protein